MLQITMLIEDIKSFEVQYMFVHEYLSIFFIY